MVRAKSLSYCLSLCWVVMSWMHDLVLSHTLVMGDKVVPSYFAAVSNGAMEIAWKMPAVPRVNFLIAGTCIGCSSSWFSKSGTYPYGRRPRNCKGRVSR